MAGTPTGTDFVAVFAGLSHAVAIVVTSNEPSVANANGPYLVAVGEEVALDSDGSNDPGSTITLTETWTASGVVSQTIPYAYTTATEPGIYGVTLVVNDGTDDSQAACCRSVYSSRVYGIAAREFVPH